MKADMTGDYGFDISSSYLCLCHADGRGYLEPLNGLVSDCKITIIA